MDQRNLHVLPTEFYKVKMGIAPDLIKELFPLSTHAYHLTLPAPIPDKEVFKAFIKLLK